jgi:uncharacterized cupredoxin-like copper-binding protein
MIAAFTVVGTGAFVAGAQNSTPSPTASACGSTSDCVELGEYDIFYKPNVLTIPADKDIKVEIVNHGVTLHNFSVTDHKNSGLKNLNIVVNTDPGKTSETTINAPAGDYYFFCDQPGHEAAGMFGYIHVAADATPSTSEATVTPRAG